MVSGGHFFCCDLPGGGWEQTHARREPRLNIKSYIRKPLLRCAAQNAAVSFTVVKRLRLGRMLSLFSY